MKLLILYYTNSIDWHLFTLLKIEKLFIAKKMASQKNLTNGKRREKFIYWLLPKIENHGNALLKWLKHMSRLEKEKKQKHARASNWIQTMAQILWLMRARM